MALAGSGAGPPGGEPPRPPHGQKRPGAEAEYPGQSKAAKRRARRDRVEKEVAEMGPDHPGWVCDPRRPDRDEYRQMRDMARQEGYQVPSLPSGHQQSHFAKSYSLHSVGRPKFGAAIAALRPKVTTSSPPIPTSSPPIPTSSRPIPPWRVRPGGVSPAGSAAGSRPAGGAGPAGGGQQQQGEDLDIDSIEWPEQWLDMPAPRRGCS